MLERYKPYTAKSIRETPYWSRLTPLLQEALTVVSRVMPFRTNEYVLRELIDWDAIPDDPIFRMTFPHPDMLLKHEYIALRDLIQEGDETAIRRQIEAIWRRMNPHPAGQLTHNGVTLNGKVLPGIQHKYRETVLFFPGAGQTCHAYCTFCFRWAQFIGEEDLKFNARESQDLADYLRAHPEVTDVLITGGDPLIMNSRSLAGYLMPLLGPGLGHLKSIRIGTKSVAYWPQRFVTDKDAEALLTLFRTIVDAGINLSVMGHYNHPIELSTAIAKTAVKCITASGATLRMQAPVIRHINDDPQNWIALWTEGVRLGAMPYYMFVERDTGPSHYFALPLARAFAIFQAAYRSVSGLSRTVRGPSMSTFYGKVVISGVETVAGEKVFVLQLLQARDPSWVLRPFFARYDSEATWFDQLIPAFGASHFFFQDPPEVIQLIPLTLQAS